MARVKKTMLWRDVLATFKKSKGRFCSIVCLIALGSFALVGLKVAGPDMRATSARFFDRYDMADVTVIGDLGLDADDQADIKATPGVREVEFGYLKDVTIANTNDSVRLESVPERVSQFEIVDGRLPSSSDEIAVDSFLADRFPLGSTVDLVEKAGMGGSTVLTQTHFRVVGHVSSVEIIASVNKGKTTVGTGDLTGYAVVTPEVFNADYRMVARLTFDDTEGLDPYGAEYLARVAAHKEELATALASAPQRRLAAVRAEFDDKIADGQATLDNARRQLSGAKTALHDVATRLADGQATLDDTWSQLEAVAARLAGARETLSASHDRLADARAQLDEGERQLAEARFQYATAVQALDDAKVAAEHQTSQVQAQIDAQRADVAQKREQLEQARAAGLIDDASYIQQSAQLDAAEQRLSAAQAALDQQVANGQAEFAAKQQELDAVSAQIDASAEKLSSSQAEYAAGKATYDAGMAEYSEGLATYQQGRAAYDEAAGTLAQKRSEYESALAEYNEALPDAEREIADGEASLADAREQRDSIDQPAYAVDSRRETPGSEGYKTYSSVSEIVDSLADVFPYFLYLVAALVASTTMTRMVDEERVNSGTLKALGYRDRDVMLKFVVYGATAGGIGAVVGIVLGHTLMPFIVYSAYGSKFVLPPIEMHFHLLVSVAAFALALAVSVGPAAAVAKRSLAEKPAQLLLPKAPAAGSKIILERISPVWNRLNFTQKVTCRNLLRYKKRMLMTVVGVAGAVCLMFCGFAVRNSINGLADAQFGDIIGYDLIVAENSHVSEDERAGIDAELSSSAVASHLPVRYESVTKRGGAKGDDQKINLLVPEDASAFANYLRIRERSTGRALELPLDGAVITERFASLIGLRVGDTLTFKDADGRERSVRVAGICEMYMEHFMFMSAEAYQNCFGKPLETNASVVNLTNSGTTAIRSEAARFMSLSGVMGCVQSAALIDQINVVVKSLNMIMGVLIVVAVLLAVVIVYNLVTINVAERIRELSTIKVLGFYPREVTMYIYRETIINSCLALPVGWLLGWMLQQYIIAAVPPENVMFDPACGWLPFVVSTVVIVLVVAAMYAVVNRYLRRVDMLEALKSVD